MAIRRITRRQMEQPQQTFHVKRAAAIRRNNYAAAFENRAIKTKSGIDAAARGLDFAVTVTNQPGHPVSRETAR